jgi:hypothetical protein
VMCSKICSLNPPGTLRVHLSFFVLFGFKIFGFWVELILIQWNFSQFDSTQNLIGAEPFEHTAVVPFWF